MPAASGSPPNWLLGPWRTFGSTVAAGGDGALIFFVFIVVAFLLYLVVLACARRLPLRSVLGAVVFCQVVFMLAPPLLSQDVFSYIAYARLAVEHGLNPYTHVPAEITTDPILRYVGWRHTTSAYGPLFTIATYPLGALSVPVAYWALKSVVAAASLATVLAVRSVARAFGRSATVPVAFVGLNPILLVGVIGGAHNDALAVLVGMLGVLAVVRERSFVAGAVGLAAGAVKSSLALWGGFLVLGAERRARALIGFSLALLTTGAVAVAFFGYHATGALTAAGENQARVSFYSLPNQATRALAALAGVPVDGLLLPVRTLFACAGVAVLVYLIWRVLTRRHEWLLLAGWATLVLLIASAWLLPWYLLWLLPLAAIADDRRLKFATLLLTAYLLPIRVPL